MRIASFNLESLDTPPKASMPLEDRIKILRPQLERLNADILCLQEVNGQHVRGRKARVLYALEELLKGTPYESFDQFSTSNLNGDGVLDVHNLVIVSRYPFERQQEILHDHVAPFHFQSTMAVPAEPEAQLVKWDRPILSADIKLANGPRLTVLNVHLRAPLAAVIEGQKVAPFVWKTIGGWAEGFCIASMKRAGQALEIRLHLEKILNADPDRLIAVCGDFNADLHETPLRTIIGAEEDTGSGKLAARALVSLDRSLPNESRYTVLHHGRPQMLDHILVSRSFLAYFKSIEIHNETIDDELVGYAKVDRPPDSYHAPVVAEFGSI
jgi:endonuclease/exonuclease/phosphatase family metal-dependent hydrolase